MKSFVVSDIHDHYDLMIESLKKNGFEIENNEHRLILCGDAFYSGPQPGELYRLLRDLNEKGRLVFIYGNHDVELLDNLKAGEFRRPGNRTCAELLVKHMTGKSGLSDSELIDECNELGFTDFLENVPKWFYEKGRYIFTHGFIPTDKRQYKPDWRKATEKDWRTAASRGDAMMLSMRYGIKEPDKVIVCGHYSAARCFMMRNATEDDWNKKIYKDVSRVPAAGFRTFIGDTFIGLDGSVKKSGIVNCLVIED